VDSYSSAVVAASVEVHPAAVASAVSAAVAVLAPVAEVPAADGSFCITESWK